MGNERAAIPGAFRTRLQGVAIAWGLASHAGWPTGRCGCSPPIPTCPTGHADGLGVALVGLDLLLVESDIISLHASLTHKTRRLIGEKELRRMKPTALLVNPAGGDRGRGGGGPGPRRRLDRRRGAGHVRPGAAAGGEPAPHRRSRAAHPDVTMPMAT